MSGHFCAAGWSNFPALLLYFFGTSCAHPLTPGGCGAAQLPPDELAANQAAQRAALENKLHGDIKNAEEQQHMATEKGARDLAATGDVESPGQSLARQPVQPYVDNGFDDDS